MTINAAYGRAFGVSLGKSFVGIAGAIIPAVGIGTGFPDDYGIVTEHMNLERGRLAAAPGYDCSGHKIAGQVLSSGIGWQMIRTAVHIVLLKIGPEYTTFAPIWMIIVSEWRFI